MKKLLVLALVLSMATMANAALQLTIGGVAATDQTIAAGESISNIGITSTEVMQYQSGLYYVLAAETAFADIDYLSGIVVCTDSGMSINHEGDAVGQGFTIPAGFNGVGGGAFNMDAATGLPAQQLFDSFELTGGAAGTAHLTLYTSPDGGVWDNAGSVAITITGSSIPEPMTLGLLSIGGLFLRRRK